MRPVKPLLFRIMPPCPAINLSLSGVCAWSLSCVRLFSRIRFFSHVRIFSRVQLFTTWTIACQAPLSMEFSRQEYWSGLYTCKPHTTRLNLTTPLAAEVEDMSNISQGTNGQRFQPTTCYHLTYPVWSWPNLLGKRGGKLHDLVSATAVCISSHDNICNPTQALLFSLD